MSLRKINLSRGHSVRGLIDPHSEHQNETLRKEISKSSGDIRLRTSFNLSSTSTVKWKVCKICRYMTTNMTEDIGSEFLRTSFRDLIISLIFLGCLIYITTLMNVPYHQAVKDGFRRYFITQQFFHTEGTYVKIRQFENIRTVKEIWSYLNAVVLENMYEAELVDKKDKELCMLNNHILGVARMRQVQVANGSCKIIPTGSQYLKGCYYAVKDDRYKNTKDFGDSDAFKYRNRTGSPTYVGVDGVYTDGGYVVDLMKTKEESRLVIEDLRSRQWITPATRFVILNFAYYNVNINFFSFAGLMFELPRTGGVITSYYFESLEDPFLYSTHYFTLMFLECLILIILIYFSFETLVEIVQLRLKFLLLFWGYIDAGFLIISVIFITNNIHYKYSYQILNDLEHHEGYINFEMLRYYCYVDRNWFGLMMFLSYLRIAKFIGISRTMRQMKRTLKRCATDLVSFFIMFLVIFFAFAEVAYLLFGSQLEDFRTFLVSVMSLMRTLFGDFDYKQIHQTQQVLAPIFFVCYIFFIFFVILNMYMAIINESFADVKTEMHLSANEQEMVDYVKSLMKRLLCPKLRAKFSSSDHILKPNKAKELLVNCGFDISEIEYFFASYYKEHSTIGINMEELRDDILPDSRQMSQITGGSVTANDFFEHEERIQAIEVSLETLVEHVNRLVHNLEERRNVLKRPRME